MGNLVCHQFVNQKQCFREEVWYQRPLMRDTYASTFTISWMISPHHDMTGHFQVAIIKREIRVQVYFRNAYYIEFWYCYKYAFKSCPLAKLWAEMIFKFQWQMVQWLTVQVTPWAGINLNICNPLIYLNIKKRIILIASPKMLYLTGSSMDIVYISRMCTRVHEYICCDTDLVINGRF